MSAVDVELPLPSGRRPVVHRSERISLSRERWPELPDRVRGAPELVVEVVSPGSQAYDSLTKRQDYAQAGVREYWLIDPLERREYVFRPGDAAEVPAVAGDALASVAVPGFVLDLPRVRENCPPPNTPPNPEQRPG